ncbi:MAG: rhodanese-like domain-containing protein [Myxococcales bacterium]
MRILRTSLLAAAVLFLAGAARADLGKDEGFGDLTVDQVADLIAKKDADVFDNNGKDVYEKGHVPTAKWLAFSAVKESDLPRDKSRKLVFYCANPH